MEAVACPTCKKKIKWDINNPFRPFCCERCKLIDLGAWADGSYAIPAEPANEDDMYNNVDKDKDD